MKCGLFLSHVKTETLQTSVVQHPETQNAQKKPFALPRKALTHYVLQATDGVAAELKADMLCVPVGAARFTQVCKTTSVIDTVYF